MDDLEADMITNQKPDVQEQATSNILKPNLPNVNVPERIILCIDICYADQKSLYKLADGTSYTPINLLKRILTFFIHMKSAINKRTEFALLIMKSNDVCWVSDFTSNIKDLIYKIDLISAEHCELPTFDFSKVFDLVLKQVRFPEYNEDNCLLPPQYTVRMIVLYGRANCIPKIPQENQYINLKNETYFFIDILLIHEDDCETHRCENIFDALQYLDNGYSYVFEVSRNTTKAHDYIAKLLAHPLQRALQSNTKYSFNNPTE